MSCANNANKKETVSIKTDKAISEVKKEEFLYQQLTNQKLQDYFDLLLLQKNHPEFKNDIIKQLQDISDEQRTISATANNIKIQNIKQIGMPQKLSESVQKLTLSFDIVIGKTRQKDTIFAMINAKKISLDGKEFVSTKVFFSKK
jgi:hypothetical protein